MTIHKFTRLTVPPTLEKQLEVLEAFRTLVSQDDELVRQRCAEIAALRREAEDLRRCVDAFCRQLPELRAEILMDLKAQKYSPDQPRVPAGQSGGGQWTKDGEDGGPSNLDAPANRGEVTYENEPSYAVPVNDSRVISDATPDNTWKPGAQYAGGIEEDENRGRGSFTEGSPGQEARLEYAEIEWRSVFSQVQRYDPNWRPTPSFRAPDSIEAKIAEFEAGTKEAKEYLQRLHDLATPRDRNTGEPVPAGMTRTGDPLVDSTADKLNDILDRVVARIGPRPDLSPQRYGTMVHEAFKREVRAAGLPGIEADDVEGTFGVNEDAPYGAKESVRPDVVLRDKEGNIVAMYDVKTGHGFSKFSVIKYRVRTETDSFIPLFELHPGGRTIEGRTNQGLKVFMTRSHVALSRPTFPGGNWA
jgi:hypothetical protein